MANGSGFVVKTSGKGGTNNQAGVNQTSNKTQAQLIDLRENESKARNLKQLINLGRGDLPFKKVWGNRVSSCEKFSASTKRSRAEIPGIATDPLDLPSETEGKYLCQAPFAFEEQDNPARESDYRVFIEGVELSSYVRSSLVWTIENTGGINSCRFTLSNNQDAFIITPLNVCSNLSLNGWRVDTLNVYSPYQQSETRYDELAKYLIYKRKFERVAPGTSRADIDSETGMWYYPLAPMGLIFNRHDTVRVFRKLSHIDAARIYPPAGSGGELRSFDLWAPAFAGFIRSASYTDDYINGDRSVSIECYDFRGLMEGMRVRTVGLRLGTPNPGSKAATKTVADKTLGTSLADASRDGLATLLNKLYDSYKRTCEYNTAAQQAASNTQALLILSSTCLGQAATRIKPLSDRVAADEQSFSIHAAALKQLSGETAVLDLTASSATAALSYVKGPASSQSAAATGTQQGQSTAPSGGTSAGATPKANAPTITAPSLSPEVIATLTTTSSADLMKPGQSSVTPTISASGDVETMQALITYLENPDLVVALYPPKSGGDSSCIPYLTQANLTADKLAALVSNCKECSPDSGSKANCIDELLMAYAAKLNKSVVVYTYSRLGVESLGYIKSKDGCAQDSLAPAMNIGSKSYGSLEIGINIAQVKQALIYAIRETQKRIDPLKKSLQADADALWKDRQDILQAMTAAGKEEKAAASKLTATQKNRLGELARAQKEALDAGQKKADASGVPNAGNLGDLVVNDPTFEGRTAGIFSDLIKKVGQGSHPLEGMSYEAALTWLCCAPTTGGGPGCLPGELGEFSAYGTRAAEQQLQAWNKLVAFGVARRPLTFDEVTAIGKASGSDVLNNGPDVFSPYRPLLHLMLPAKGTGARAIVQQDLTSNTGNSTNFQYETRKGMIDRISTLLNYQVFVSPWGDIIAEFPHYNSIPQHWGEQFRGAYVLDKEITGLTVNEESSDLYTAWVITGMESTKEAQAAGAASQFAQNMFYKISILAPILARRLGVRVEHINLEIPGVGGQISNGSPEAGGTEALLVWGLLHIQRQLGEAHRVTINEFPDRPYLFPNRPLYIVPRQKYCMIKSVTYTMDKPNGNATVGVECNFTRWLYRDGTFRQVCGGKNHIIDYTGLFTGQQVTIREGSGNSTRKKKSAGQAAQDSLDKADTAWGCAPALGKQAEAAQSFYGQDLAGQENAWTSYGGNTSGANGLPGFIPPNSALGQGRYGTAVARNAPNPGNKSANSDTAAAGLLVEGKKREGKPSAYNLQTLFLNPYPFGVPVFSGSGKDAHDVANIQTWGFIRLYHKQEGLMGYANRNGDLELNWHPGIDIMGQSGWALRAPFDMVNMVATLQVGPATGQDRNLNWVKVTGLDDPIASKVAVLNSSGRVEVQMRTDNSGPSLWMLVYDAQYKMFKEFAKNAKSASGKNLSLRISRGKGSGGIGLACYGYLSAPRSGGTSYEGKRLYAKLVYYHCSAIATNSAGQYYGVDALTAKAGDTIAFLGNTGNSTTPHAHIELYVHTPAATANSHAADEQLLYEEVNKANDEFLTTQILLKVTGGHPDSNQLSPEWKKYFAERNSVAATQKAGFTGTITTPAEAVKYLLAYKASQRLSTELADDSGFIATNPLFFYAPQEYVPKVSDRLSKLNLTQPQWNTQTLMNTFQADSSSSSPICGKIPPQSAVKATARFNKCMLVAKQLATSSYSSYADHTKYCLSSLQEDVEVAKNEARREKNKEDAAQKAAAVTRSASSAPASKSGKKS